MFSILLRTEVIILATFELLSANALNLAKNLLSSKLKELADNTFKFDENGSKLSKQVENIVGKGEIALFEKFLLFPQCFQKACFSGASKGVIVWEWVKSSLTFHFLSRKGS